MSDTDWYRRRLSRQPPPPPQARAYPQPQPQVQTWQANATYNSSAVTQVSQTPLAPQAPPKVTIQNLWDSMHHWRGGQAHRVDTSPCPNCGSNQFYSRTQGIRRGPPPAPHCYNCGYNGGLFEQGDIATWEGS